MEKQSKERMITMPSDTPPHDCEMKGRIEALEKETEKHREDHRKFYERFNSLEKSAAITEERYEKIREDTKEIKESIKKNNDAISELKDKPAKRWDSLIMCIISAMAGAFVIWLGMGMPGS